ncbi:MAG: ribonuclease G [Pseudomonadota bacterium]
MNNEIIISLFAHETRVAVVEHGIVQEVHIEHATLKNIVGNIYWGQVMRVLPGIQSAFINIGLDKAAFLHVADMWEYRHLENPAPIEKMLHEGQPILVQVLKEPLGSKGARLSTQISLAGRFLVHLPRDDSHIGISQRIENEEEREHLRDRMQHLLTEDLKGGFIIRTMAEHATDDELRSDIEYLTKLWQSLKARVQSAAFPSQIYHELSLPQRVLRDFADEATQRICVDDREVYESLHRFCCVYMPQLVNALQYYDGERLLFDLYHVDVEIEKALSKRVDLKSGGYLIIEQTEAMTTVDVNTGGFLGEKNFEETVFKTNLEATQAIARQLRLRNLGGIIMIDFIDMDTAAHRQAVLDALNRALSKDRMRLSVNGFSSLGLVEMTRKRTRESLAHMLCSLCSTCHGRGEVKSPQTLCYLIMREILREDKEFEPSSFRILASQPIIDCFLEEESATLEKLSKKIAKPISLHVETEYAPDQYDLILV